MGPILEVSNLMLKCLWDNFGGISPRNCALFELVIHHDPCTQSVFFVFFTCFFPGKKNCTRGHPLLILIVLIIFFSNSLLFLSFNVKSSFYFRGPKVCYLLSNVCVCDSLAMFLFLMGVSDGVSKELCLDMFD